MRRGGSGRTRRRRGPEAHQVLRDQERQIRIRVVAFARWAWTAYRRTRAQAAQMLGMRAATLMRWEEEWNADRLRAAARGRPAQRADMLTQLEVHWTLRDLGPGVGLPTLREIFPHAARAELREILKDYREAHMRQGKVTQVLAWKRPGAVWAMDYTKPPKPIDGIYGKVLVVRDLASGYQMLAQPVEEECAQATADALKALFGQWGVPLVVKSDNGSPFTADEVTMLLARQTVWHLLSPKAMPQYNGAAEAGIGSIKTRAEHEAARHGRPGEWTCDDVEAARMMANETARPRGESGPTPEALWQKRRRVTDEHRKQFGAEVRRKTRELLEEVHKERNETSASRPQPSAAASVNRIAVSQALEELGYLEVGRRRIPLPIFRRNRAKIT